MRTSNLNIIKNHEGLRLKAYKCSAGVLTIGYGHTKDVTHDMVITEPDAELLLIQDIIYFEKQLNSLNLNLNQNQFDALISWIFNLGFYAFMDSTLKRLIERGNYMDDIMKVHDLSNGEGCKKFLLEDKRIDLSALEYNFVRWCQAGGNALRGLYNRRKDEYKLFTTV